MLILSMRRMRHFIFTKSLGFFFYCEASRDYVPDRGQDFLLEDLINFLWRCG